MDLACFQKHVRTHKKENEKASKKDRKLRFRDEISARSSLEAYTDIKYAYTVLL